MTDRKPSPKPAPHSAPAAAAKSQFWGDRLAEAPEMANVAYCAGRDMAARPPADEILVPFDLWQNRAHSAMLAGQGIIPKATAKAIHKALDDFERRHAAGDLQLDPAKEDVHTNIEHFVAATAGPEIAGVMHTGRSRNDQTTTVVRMFVRDRLLAFGLGLSRLITAILAQARAQAAVPVAGFTHYQPGSVTTMGHWFASHAQALLRDLERIEGAYARVNRSPLGAAASFGTGWPIDRARTAALLGFAEVQDNSLDCITNRWEMEADAAVAVGFAMTHLSIVAQDLVMLSSPGTALVRIADRYVTGSSIMPQKRNPDFAEVTRAKAAVIQNNVGALFGVAKGAFSGYNRDTQWTKYLVMDVFDEAAAAPAVFQGVFETLTVDAARCEATARRDFVDAVDVADVLARESGLPFRTAYGIASKAVKLSEDAGLGAVDPSIVRRLAAEAGVSAAKAPALAVGTPADIVARKHHAGGPAPRTVRAAVTAMTRANDRATRTLRAHADALSAARTAIAKCLDQRG